MRLNFIQPSTSIENACAESFVARLRDECLNENWFLSLKDAKILLGAGYRSKG
jgi:putative transposase